MDDRELLQEYRERQSEKAFAELVARHVRLVYATALRLTGERQAAEDVVQAVFLLLARKSWMVRDGNALPGWLYRATQRTAFNELRKEQRRRQRETEAMNNAELDAKTQAMLAKLLPLLDEALGRLSPVEQNLIILRFFENKSLRETGATAGLSEQATHNRITRAVEKLRQYFARADVTVASVGVETALTTPASQAMPVGLAAKVTGMALAGSGAALGFGDIVLKFFLTMNTKTQVALMVVVVALLALPFLRSANVPDNAPPVASNSSVAPPTAPVVVPQTTAPQSRTVAQPIVSAAAQIADATNSVDSMAQSAPPPRQPIGALPLGGQTGSPANAVSSASVRSVAAGQSRAANQPLSHNVAIRITGILGVDHPIDVTFTGIQRFNRSIFLGTTGNGLVTGNGPAKFPVNGQVQASVSLAGGGYKVDFTAGLNMLQGTLPMKSSLASGSVVLKPGEATSASSDDGIVNVKVTLTEAPEASLPLTATGSPSKNLTVRIQGDIAPKNPIDLTTTSFVAPTTGPGTGESHQLGTVTFADGEVQPEVASNNIAILNPSPNSNTDPGAYLVRYMLSVPHDVITTNSSGDVIGLMGAGFTCSGQVLLEIGQTATVQDVAGQGSIQVTLTAAK